MHQTFFGHSCVYQPLLDLHHSQTSKTSAMGRPSQSHHCLLFPHPLLISQDHAALCIILRLQLFVCLDACSSHTFLLHTPFPVAHKFFLTCVSHYILGDAFRYRQPLPFHASAFSLCMHLSPVVFIVSIDSLLFSMVCGSNGFLLFNVPLW
jgi:hypothetical protein